VRIVLYVESRFGVDVAERVLEDIESACERLAANPGVGHRRDDLTRDDRIRFWPVGPTLIAYRAEPELLEVLSVERGDRDWRSLLTRNPAAGGS
jgi:plasmid stabilization system protein ParE